MKLIAGLGNPGPEYNFTRHNFGFLALDFYLKRYNQGWGSRPFHGATVAKIGPNLFIKPQDFYNLSGRAVRELSRYYKIPTSDILVICDDFNLPFGSLRFRMNGSAGGNNGLKSVISELQTEAFPRLRLGTGNPPLRQQLGDVEFVLSRFTPEEKDKLPVILANASMKIDDFLEQ